MFYKMNRACENNVHYGQFDGFIKMNDYAFCSLFKNRLLAVDQSKLHCKVTLFSFFFLNAVHRSSYR